MIDTVHASDYFKNLIKETFPNVIIDVVSDDSFSVEIPNISLIDFHAFASKHRFSLTCQNLGKFQ